VRSSPRAVASIALTSAIVVALTPVVAHAQYLDPGAGSIIVQAVIAVVVGVAATTRIYWYRISAFFDRRSKEKGEGRK
jgi:hypothetical protein